MSPRRSWHALLLAVLGCVALAQGSVAQTATPPQSTAAPAEGPLAPLKRLFGGSPDAQPELLPPEQAFQYTLRARDANTLIAEFTPAENYYLYRDRISFEIVDPPTTSIVSATLPQGESKADPTFGTVQVFHHRFEALIALRRAAGDADTVQLRATYQGCNDPLGVCYPPIDKTLTVSLPAAGAGPAAATGAGAAAATGAVSATDTRSAANAGASDESRVRALFAGGSRWAMVAAFFGFGILLAFTPCMLPMIPILSGIIVGHGHHMTRSHALGLSAVYVLAMAITYALAGVAAGLAGTLLSAYLQNPWVLGAFAILFVALALSMFGLYELQLPSALQSRLAAAGSGVKGGRVAGVFAMGVLSAVIVGPCVAAPLAGALLYIGQTRDGVLGGTALFAMALGMGVPLLAVGATAGSLLPKAGDWMESVKSVFGVAMLAVAIYTVSPVIPVVAQQLLWAALLIVPAIYLHALDPLPVDAPGYRRLFKGLGVLALVFGGALMVGALSGHRELLQPLAGFGATNRAERIDRSELAFQPVSSVADVEARVQAAQGRPVVLDFWAEWCVSCKEMDQFTFSDSRVQARLKDAVLLRADVTANTPAHRELLARFSLFGPPGIIFFDRSGRPLDYRVIGYQSADRFLAALDRVDALR